MKIDQLIVQHLYNTKHVTLQGIGTIHLDPSIQLPAEGDRAAAIPENAFRFDYNLKAGEDGSLIDFIVLQTKKMKPLATSDLESYSMLAKQFLNIGKPLVIEGVGTIQKNQLGLYEFIQGHFVTPRIDDIPKQLKEKTEENISFESESRKKGNSRQNVVISFIAFFAVLAGFAIYYFIFKKQAAETVIQPQTFTDTVSKKIDTTVKAVHDSTLTTSVIKPQKNDSVNFQIVIRRYKDSAAAEKKLQFFSAYGHKLIIIKGDSSAYLLAMPFISSLSDTLRARDSLQKIFGYKPYIIVNR